MAEAVCLPFRVTFEMTHTLIFPPGLRAVPTYTSCSKPIETVSEKETERDNHLVIVI